ncbi:MAG: acyl-CoA thioester hydrolase/BAAT C-terminal domain-containing protein [Lachnospira eligens]
MIWINSKKLFDDSEAAHPITEEETIKIEKSMGHQLLIGAEDDVLWDTAKYIRRMELRMKERPQHMQVGVCYLRACDPFRFSGEYVKDDAANWSLESL